MNKLIILIAILFITQMCSAQNRFEPFINTGLGMNFKNEKIGYLMGVELGKGNSVYGLGFYLIDEYSFESEREKFKQVHFSYGYRRSNKLFRMTLSSGIAIGQYEPEFTSNKSTILSLPVLLRLEVTRLKLLGIGIQAYGNINSENSVYIPMIVLTFG